VGGLRDTIVPYPHPQATGFTFTEPDPETFYQTILEAVDLWKNKKAYWRAMVERAMSQDFSWENSAARYIELYRSLGARV